MLQASLNENVATTAEVEAARRMYHRDITATMHAVQRELGDLQAAIQLIDRDLTTCARRRCPAQGLWEVRR